MKNVSSRKNVYEVINDERDYQELRWGEHSNASIAEFLLYIEHHLNKAKNRIYEDTNSSLDEIRKITALGVACMEQHGALYRALEE